jgi:diaminopimelate epimerase
MSNKVEYIILSPSGNITALVFANRSVELANKILNDDSRIEQVLFAYKASFENKIYWHGIMSGEEFCVNALRALGYYLLDGEDGYIDIFSSGVNSLINIEVLNKNVEIKLPLKSFFIKDSLIEADTFLVKLSGITHVVIKENSKFYRSDVDNQFSNQ